MPLPRVRLADLAADDLAAEMLARVRAHVPDWRPQPGDPGRTLIELFAWLGETLLYRVDLIPERQRLEFLRLLGQGLRPATPARGLIQLAPANPARPRRIVVEARSAVSGPVPFETGGRVVVQPFEGRVVIRRRPDDRELEGLDEVLRGLETLLDIDGGEPYVTTPLFADGHAVGEGVDPLGASVDGALWIALLATDGEAPARQAALEALRDPPVVLEIGIVPPERADEPGSPPVDLPDVWRWQITSGRILPSGDAELVPVEVEADGTAALAREGTLRLVLPDADRIGAPPDDVGQDERAGVGLRPPRLDLPELAGRLVAWLRLGPADGRPGALPVSWMGINAVAVDQRRTLLRTVVATLEGVADEEVQLPGESIDPDDLRLELTGTDGRFEPWQPVPDLGAAEPEDAVFELDAEAGRVRFGDGLRGRLPEPGARLLVRHMRSGGGRAGNLPAGSLADLPGAEVSVLQPAPLRGGEDAESLAEAERRLPARLRHQDRCVTAADYHDLALSTPGVELARAEVLPRFRPFQRDPNAPGVVSVVVLPRRNVPSPPNPRPDRPTLERVKAHLDARRPLATELYVVGCEYVPLALSLSLGVREGHARDVVVRAVRSALALHLWPLAPGGRDGEGWPLGQPVADRELEVVVARVTGVRATMGVNLFRATAAGWQRVPPGAGATARLELDPWQLPELLGLRIALDAAAAPAAIEEPAPADARPRVAVPIVPEVC